MIMYFSGPGTAGTFAGFPFGDCRAGNMEQLGEFFRCHLFLADLLILAISLNFARFASRYRLLSAA